MNKIKLVMADLDGTVVLKGNEITDLTINAIDELIKQGIEFVPATGRNLDSIPEYFINHPKINYIVSSNGALISNNNPKKAINFELMDSGEALEILELAHHMASSAFVVTNSGLIMERHLFELFQTEEPELSKRFHSTTTIVEDIVAHVKSNDVNIKKVEFEFKDLILRNKFHKEFRKFKSLNTVSSSDSNIEITAKSASKGNALGFLKNHLGLSADETLAIGDSENDISMLKEAGLSIAMGDAAENVREFSDFTTDMAIDDGFFKAIKKVFSN